MKGHWLWIVIVANLLGLLALVFVYPHLMVSPGPLMPAHAALATDCFACHAPLRGASAERCMTCHALADIGVRTTKGLPIKAMPADGATRVKLSFHQELAEQNCIGCHSDHARPKLTGHGPNKFSHALLRVETRARCESCHTAPRNEIHRNPDAGCAQCHKAGAWKPATFEHDKFFVLDNNHNAACTTCHTTNDYSKYTCYGCHEHTLANVRGKHLEEGIQNFGNCVACHRSAHGEAGEGGEGKGERNRGEHD